MKIKTLTITALVGVFLAGNTAFAWPNFIHGYNKHPVKTYHKVITHRKVITHHKPYRKHYYKPHRKHYYYKPYRKVIKHVYVKPSMYHSHPANGLTNDLFHSHANGNNHHVHNYGTGGHTYGYVYKPHKHKYH